MGKELKGGLKLEILLTSEIISNFCFNQFLEWVGVSEGFQSFSN
jgi:hypothetical protein